MAGLINANGARLVSASGAGVSKDCPGSCCGGIYVILTQCSNPIDNSKPLVIIGKHKCDRGQTPTSGQLVFIGNRCYRVTGTTNVLPDPIPADTQVRDIPALECTSYSDCQVSGCFSPPYCCSRATFSSQFCYQRALACSCGRRYRLLISGTYNRVGVQIGTTQSLNFSVVGSFSTLHEFACCSSTGSGLNYARSISFTDSLTVSSEIDPLSNFSQTRNLSNSITVGSGYLCNYGCVPEPQGLIDTLCPSYPSPNSSVATVSLRMRNSGLIGPCSDFQDNSNGARIWTFNRNVSLGCLSLSLNGTEVYDETINGGLGLKYTTTLSMTATNGTVIEACTPSTSLADSQSDLRLRSLGLVEGPVLGTGGFF